MRLIPTIKMSPPRVLILSFLSIALLGTLLLELPFAANVPVRWADSLFIATSALTVTGLSPIDVETTFTLFGELVIMSLIQIGGLGIMSFAILIFVMLGKKISLNRRIWLQQSLNQTSVGGIIRLLKRLFIFSIIIEGIAAILLSFNWIPELGFWKGLYYSLFHSVSAFNNAGFSLFPDNLISHVGNPIVNIVISSLFILGGIGFTVMIDVWNKRSFKKLSLHSKLIITFTLILNIFGMFVIFALEYGNPGTLGPLSTFEKWLAAYFQSTSLRTAGFNTIDLANIQDPTALFMMLLMFIGAGSGSTGGGIKLTTFLVIIFGVYTFLKENEKIVIFNRTIKNGALIKSLAICIISITFIFIAIFTLAIVENQPLMPMAFEVVSAFGTVGLSMGLTGQLSAMGKLIITFVMFFGKLGPLTLAFSLARKPQAKIRYPEEEILIG